MKRIHPYPSLVALLRARAAEKPEVAYTFLADGESEAARLTFAQLDRQARGIATALAGLGAAGGRAVLLYPAGLDFIGAFFGCLYAGTVAVPAYPPRSQRGLPRLLSILEDAQPRVVLTTEALLDRSREMVGDRPELRSVEWLATDSAAAREGDGREWREPRIDGDTLAFLQYTSGSTSAPKGVMVSHGNLLHNEELIRQAFGQSASSVIVGWLPLYHDMGLIGNVLQPLYAGASCVLMPPVAFLQQPLRWLQAISRYRGTTSGGPNFAYELCARKIGREQKAGLDLASWRVAFNGAEPVRAETLERFAAAFAPCGFRRQAFYPCYGLAEATLFVTGGAPDAAPVVRRFEAAALEQDRAVPAAAGAEGARSLVGCGGPREEQRLAIVDPATGTEVAAGRVGEIWTAGASVAQGYWRRPELTERDFHARLAGGGEGPFLRTGDLGFTTGGELYVTGRLKDLIIIRGRNHYPQDLELTAERAHQLLRPGCGAAFSIDGGESGGEERLVLVQEAERRSGRGDLESVAEAIRSAVAQEHEVQAHDVVLIRTGTLPKTSSGKVQRARCRAAYLAGELATLASLPLRDGGAEEPPAGFAADAALLEVVETSELTREALLALPPAARRGALEPFLRGRLAAVLRIAAARVEPDRPLTALGLDSLAAVELQQEVERRLGTPVALAGLLDGLSLRELAGEILERTGEEAAAAGPRPALSGKAGAADRAGGDFPLSYGQRALWFLQRLAPASAAYHITAAVEIRGDLDAAALRRSFQALADRHPALRTTFHAAAGGPVQRVHAPGWEGGLVFTAGEAPAGEELAARLGEEAFRPFDLEAGPLLRVALLRRAAGLHAMVLAVHHLVADFASLAVLVRELEWLYGRETGADAGAGAPLEPLPLTYADWAAWQAERLAGPAGERLWSYWRQALQGPVPALDLPADRPRPAVQTDRGGSRGLALSAATAAGLRALSGAAGSTLFVTLLAGFQALLHRITGQTDLPVGCPVAGRGAPELAGLVGYFVNPVVVRGDAAGDPTGGELLERVRRAALGALEHAEYPFALLTERLQPARDPSRTPLFQAMFILQKAQRPEQRALAPFALGEEGAEIRLGPLTLRSLALAARPAQLDLTLSAAEGDGGLSLALHFNADLFDAATAERLLGHLGMLLGGLAADPARPVSSLPLLTPAEREQTRVTWNATAAEYPRQRLVHELFEAQADRTPERVALVSGGASLTYRELDRRANQLARYLRRMGIRPEVPVGVCLERTAEMVAAVLAVMKAGGAYVPLDPSYPRERLVHMLEDSRAPVVITQESLAAVLFEGPGSPLLVDAERAAIAAEPAARLGGGAPPESAAYLIYTSGSTGRPKGVQVTHRGVVNFLTAMARRPGLAAEDVLVSVTTLSFDIAGLELYLPLALGARVVLADRETAADGTALLRLLRGCGATAMQATPSTWRLLLAAGWDGRPALRALCGGEALPRELADALLARASSVWNLYGPTETTIWSAVHPVAPGSGAVPVGRPIANTRIFLLDRALQPVPAGVPGELTIGGDGLARGYFNRPELTAERFIPDPESGEPGERLYRTGDLARRRPDGALEFLGRLDHQVKVRGFRIELGEIETALAAHPAVRQAVAVAREDRLVAYLVPAAGEAPDAGALRRFLAERLPAPFVPSLFVSLERFPLTPNGKVDRKALPAPEAPRRAPAAGEADFAAPRSATERALAAVWREVLRVDAVGLDDNFFDLGGHSLLVAEVHRRLREGLGIELSMVDLFRYPTIGALARRLSPAPGAGRGVAPEIDRAARAGRPAPAAGRDVAIIAAVGRFPGAASVGELWRRLRAGEECLSAFADDELLREGADPALLRDPAYVRAGGIVEDAEMFDAGFFGFNPREAELMDPQHRVFLECAWAALEEAGYDAERYPGRIGVYAGVGVNTYLLHTGLGSEGSSAARYQAFLGNDKDFVPTRVSYKLNLRGPSVNVQTACSTSLVALHLACQGLLAGDCDMALVGGVSIRTPQKEGYLWEEGGIPSPDGHCRAFDARAQGTVFGNGVGIVVLKRLDRALADGDTVRAVVKGTAINNDGAGKVGYTAPSVDGQAQVIAEALAAAGVEPESISYVEAHGTGTAMGDPIEVAALAEVFAPRTAKRGFCALGSVKTNLGHLDTAAGMAGLIKTVLALEHREIPPSLHFETPNPRIDFASGPFFVNAALRPWTADAGAPRRAGVSAFGIGGTNAHAVLEEAPEPAPAAPSRPWQLLVLSARTPAALEAATARLAEHLGAEPGTAGTADLADIAHTLRVGRRAFAHRRAVVCRGAAAGAAALAARDPERVATGVAAGGEPPVAFLFPGQGSQHAGMGRGLYASEPVFRREVDRGAELLLPALGRDLRELLFPLPGQEAEADRELARTELAQPALFVVEHALARLWMSWGVRPDAMLGHSVGEYVAACLAGVFAVEDALALVALRGRLMGALPAGAMLAVDLPERAVAARLGSGLALAAVNAPAACVVSGAGEAVAALEEELAAAGVRCRRLHTSHAFHSAMMEPVLDAFAAAVAEVPRRAPSLRWVSNVTGTWITPQEAADPAYWSRHLRGTVRFADGVGALLAEPGRLLLEVGPGHALSTLARQCAPADGGRVILASMRHPRDPQPDDAVLLRALGRLWLAGAAVDWEKLCADERRRRVPLPTYPFERQRYRLESAKNRAAAVAATAGDPLRREPDLAGWTWMPLWRQAPRPAVSGPAAGGSWLFLLDAEGPGASLLARLAGELEGRGCKVALALARPGAGGLVRVAETVWALDPGRREPYGELLRELRAADRPPDRIVHAWSLAAAEPGLAGIAPAQTRSFDSLIFLAQELEREGLAGSTGELPVLVLSHGLHRVAGGGGLHPESALLLGPVKVIPQEMPSLRLRAVDILLPAAGEANEADEADEAEDTEAELAGDLLAELAAPPAAGETVVAWRGGERWVRGFGPAPLGEVAKPAAAGEASLRLRTGGVYLITGGFGGIGLTLAGELARLGAKLALVGRGPLAGRESGVEALEAAGAEVLPLAADVTDAAAMAAAVAAAEARFGPLHGVIHAAGLPGGRLLQLETPESAAAVMAPKVRGALVLDAVLGERPLDFLLFCSSINSVIGGVGQAGYGAANAFLDAFAGSLHRRGPRRGTYTAAIGWDRWEEVGMAARAASPVRLWPEEERRPAGAAGAGHPLLGVLVEAGAERRIFRAELSADRDWVLAEHWIAGRPMVPGTTYLEMARAAFAELAPGPVEIREALFLAPLALSPGESREVLTLLERIERGGDAWTFRIVSRLEAADGGPGHQEHARGRIGPAPERPAERRDVAALLAACGEGEITARRRRGDGPEFLTTGPRWQSLKRLHLGAGESLAVLELDPAFAGDLATFPLHPALLDVAAGAVQFVAEGDFLPLTYERLEVRAPLTARGYSHFRLRGQPGEVLTCDITLLSAEGAVLAEIEGFSMRRVGRAAAAQFQAGRAAANRVSIPALASLTAFATTGRGGAEAGGGIAPSEGVELFRRILGGGTAPHLVVSTRDLPAVIEKVDATTAARLAADLQPAAAHARPEVSSAYAPPADDFEGRVAVIWQRVLGIERVGVHDNFFELGGTSLSGVQLVSELKRELGVEIPTVSIFEAPTIAALARYLRPQPQEASLVELSRSRAEKKRQALAQVRRPAARRPA